MPSAFVIRVSSFGGLFLALSAVGGCGQKSDHVSVRGNVSYRGEPIASGSVTFFPTTGRPVNTPLLTGKYSSELRPGEYVVVVSASEPTPPGYKEGDPVPPPKIVLPAEYTSRTKSTLRATVREGQSEPIDFALE